MVCTPSHEGACHDFLVILTMPTIVPTARAMQHPNMVNVIRSSSYDLRVHTMNPKVPWFSSNTSYMCNTAVPMLVPNEPAVHGKTAIHAAQLTLDTHPRPKSTCGSRAVQLPLVALFQCMVEASARILHVYRYIILYIIHVHVYT